MVSPDTPTFLASVVPREPGRLLLIAPEPDVREASQYRYEVAGHRVRAVGDVLGADAVMRTVHVSVVVLDVTAFDDDALRVCRAICAEPAMGSTSLFIRHLRGRFLASKALEVGAHAVFRRPFDDEVLDRLLVSLLATDSRAAWMATGGPLWSFFLAQRAPKLD